MNEDANKSAETNKTGAVGDDLALGLAGQVVPPADLAGAKNGATPGGEVAQGGSALATDAGTSSTAPKKKSAVEKVRDGLWGILGGKSGPDCTCGRKPGVQGRHAKDCPVSGAPRHKHFAAVDLSRHSVAQDDAGSGGESGAGLAERQQPIAPKDHSFYRQMATRYFKNRSRFKCLRAEEKYEPLLGEAEAAKLAKEYGLDAKEIEELGDQLKECADSGDWPEVSPLLAFGILALEIELRWKINDWVNMRKIKKVLEAQKVQTAARREMTP